MHKSRVEAFSDGVIAIIITIMVLELKIPHGTQLTDLAPLLPVFISYVLSFIFIGIYWNNHHHLFQAVESVNGKILWSNLYLLFWLSLIPFTTGWMGEHQFEAVPVFLYGVTLLGAASGYFILSLALLSHHGKDSKIAKALGSDFKARVSLAIYGIALALAYWHPRIAYTLYAVVAAIWLVPDPRIEKSIEKTIEKELK
jgi:uncharacterized membrane protein